MSQAAQTNTISTCVSETLTNTTVNLQPPRPVTVMAAILRAMGADLRDDREVIHALIGAKFSGRQVLSMKGEAIALAR